MKSILSIAVLACMAYGIFAQTPKSSELVNVRGKQLYYECYGQGESLVLLHGYSQSSVSWLPHVEEFAKEFEVYLVDLTGHGQSDPFKEDLSIRSVALDLEALISHLGLEKINAIGFSFGGDVLYQLALINPVVINKMMTIGAVGTWSVEDYPEYLNSFTFENRDNFPWLKESHQGDGQIKGVMEQFHNYIVRLSDEDLQSIQPEVLIMLGDDDEGSQLDEVMRARRHLPKSDLWILPNVSHGAHEGENKEAFLIEAKRFFHKK